VLHLKQGVKDRAQNPPIQFAAGKGIMPNLKLAFHDNFIALMSYSKKTEVSSPTADVHTEYFPFQVFLGMDNVIAQ
jgi:hypothetical protein